MFGLLAPMVLALVTVAPAGVWPLEPQPEVVHRFDPPAVRWTAGHRGVDLAGSIGDPVYAALEGTVTYARTLAGRGVVVVDHGATRTTYEPVAATVHVGERVGEGSVLGTLEWFGSHCLPRACLHWGLIEGQETYLDPLRLVTCTSRPVRLLPLDRPPPAGKGCEVPSPQPVDLALVLVRLADVLGDRPGGVDRP